MSTVVSEGCWHCRAKKVHTFHDNGEVADPVLCENIGGGWETQPFIDKRHEACAEGDCVCDETERARYA